MLQHALPLLSEWQHQAALSNIAVTEGNAASSCDTAYDTLGDWPGQDMFGILMRS